MTNNKYCSAKFKSGEDLDAALEAALSAVDCATRAEAAQKAAEEAAERAEGAGGGSGADPELEGRVEVLESKAAGLESYLEERDATLQEKEVLLTQQLSDLNNRVDALGESTGSDLPAVTTEDNDKILQVVNGAWAAVSLLCAENKSF